MLHKHFPENREDVNDDGRTVKKIFMNYRFTIREVAGGAGISIHAIVFIVLAMKPGAAKFVPKLLNIGQQLNSSCLSIQQIWKVI